MKQFNCMSLKDLKYKEIKQERSFNCYTSKKKAINSPPLILKGSQLQNSIIKKFMENQEMNDFSKIIYLQKMVLPSTKSHDQPSKKLAKNTFLSKLICQNVGLKQNIIQKLAKNSTWLNIQDSRKNSFLDNEKQNQEMRSSLNTYQLKNKRKINKKFHVGQTQLQTEGNIQNSSYNLGKLANTRNYGIFRDRDSQLKTIIKNKSLKQLRKIKFFQLVENEENTVQLDYLPCLGKKENLEQIELTDHFYNLMKKLSLNINSIYQDYVPNYLENVEQQEQKQQKKQVLLRREKTFLDFQNESSINYIQKDDLLTDDESPRQSAGLSFVKKRSFNKDKIMKKQESFIQFAEMNTNLIHKTSEELSFYQNRTLQLQKNQAEQQNEASQLVEQKG